MLLYYVFVPGKVNGFVGWYWICPPPSLPPPLFFLPAKNNDYAIKAVERHYINWVTLSQKVILEIPTLIRNLLQKQIYLPNSHWISKISLNFSWTFISTFSNVINAHSVSFVWVLKQPTANIPVILSSWIYLEVNSQTLIFLFKMKYIQIMQDAQTATQR